MTLLASVMLLASACTGKQASEKTASGLEPANFRTEVDGKQTDLFVLENKNGMEVCITNFGGRIVSVMVPDKDGVMRDVVLGFDSIQDYIKFPSDFGATIGRYANRINQGKITVDGESISCRATITVIACMEVPRDTNIKCSMPAS